MATVTTAGTITAPLASGGPDASLVIGAPTVTPSSTTGPQITFTEKSSNTYVVTAAASPFAVPFGTIAEASLVYLGSDAAITVVLNGAGSLSVAADGYLLLSNSAITSISITAVALDATVEIFLAGE